MMEMSLIISTLSSFGIFISLFSSSLGKIIIIGLELIDILSMSLLWLSVGVSLAVLASNFTSFMKVLWWWLGFTFVSGFLVSTLFYFYIFFEMSLIPILLMILSMGSQPERMSAGSYLLFYTTAVSVPYFVLIMLMDLSSIGVKFHNMYWSFSGISLLLLMPFFIKMPMFGFHYWLPKAHVEASTSGSMVLAGMLLKLGSYGAVRVIGLFSLSGGFYWSSSFWILLASLSSLITFMQSDLKKLVAYSSVTHMTFMVVGLITSSKMTIASITLVSLAHGWAAMAMFFLAGTLSHSSFSRLGVLVGSEMSLFWVMIAFGLVLVSNASIPPMPSFFPEVFMMHSSLTMSGYSSVMLFLGLSLGVCYYNAYLFMWVSHMKPSLVMSGGVCFLESFNILSLIFISVESLFWLQLF